MALYYFIVTIVIVIQIFRLIKSGPKLTVAIIKDNPVNLAEGLQFEIENIGDRPTAIYPIVTSSFMTEEGEKLGMTFDIQGDEADLSLPVYGKKHFKAIPRQVQPERINGKSIHYCFDHGKGAALEVVID